jgi:hypothetical protein
MVELPDCEQVADVVVTDGTNGAANWHCTVKLVEVAEHVAAFVAVIV